MSKRDEINKAVLGNAPMAPSPSVRTAAVPFVARIAQAGAQGLLEENQKLKAERSAGRVVLAIDPKRVRFSSIANRDERSLNSTDEAFRELKHSLSSMARSFPSSCGRSREIAAHDFEVVAGHRRLKACIELDGRDPGRIHGPRAFWMRTRRS